MSKSILAALGTSIAATLLLGLASPAGTATPQVIRHVRIGVFTGPAYYSVVEGGYRAIKGPVTMAASVDPQTIADAEDVAHAN